MKMKVGTLFSFLLLGFTVVTVSLFSYEHELDAFASENGDAIVLESPYFETLNMYKGQLHCHTINSDGKQSPAAVVYAYKKAGYDFMAITDHDYVTSNPRVRDMLFINGSEVSSNLGHITTLNVPSIHPSLDAQEAVDWTQAQDGLVWLAHPNWDFTHWTVKELSSIRGYNGIEVYSDKIKSYAEDKWDYILTELDRKITATAVDDCHDIKDPEQFNGAWVMVFADSLTNEEILNSLRKGNFYSTQGPIITSVEVAGNTIRVKLNQTSTVKWIGVGGSILRETTEVRQDAYVVRGNEKYVRIRVESAGYAWTNPIYVPELVVHSASSSDLRVNPEQLITVSGRVCFEGSTIPPAGGDAVQVRVDLNGENKAAINMIEDDGSFTFPEFPVESSIGSYNYTIYTVCGSQCSVQNQTVHVIVDGLKVTNYTTNLTNDQVQLCLLYAQDDAVVQNGNVTYAGLFSLTNDEGWATFNLSSLRNIDWGLTAYAISEPTYGLTAKMQNQTVSYVKNTITTVVIKAHNPITDATWNLITGELGFVSSGTIVMDVGNLGPPLYIEVDGTMHSDWIYETSTRQVTMRDVKGRVMLHWDSYVDELWVIAAFSGGLTTITAVFFKKRGLISFLAKLRHNNFGKGSS